MFFLKKNSKLEWNSKLKILIILLSAICVIQGIFIFYLMTHTDRREHDSLDDFSTFIHKKFRDDKINNWNHFDNFFDDNFFKKKQDPFTEMEHFHEKAKKMMEDTLGDSFDHSWNSWFESRFDGANNDIDIISTETKKNYIITLVLENLEENSLNIDIEAGKISVEGNFTKTLEKKGRDGQILSRQERRQSISRVFPIPEDADHSKADIVKKKDEIIITIPKK